MKNVHDTPICPPVRKRTPCFGRVFGLVLYLALLWTPQIGQAQTQINDVLLVGSDPPVEFKYSIVVPSGYDAAVPTTVAIAFHPFHPNWISAELWCSALADFAEAKNVLLLCVDGGDDGQIESTAERDFAITLLDAARGWYSVDEDRVFGIGFSWGARALYRVALDHKDRFAGVLTLGAYVQGLNPVGQNRINQAADLPFYIMHGDQDQVVNLATGFYPIRDALIAAGARVNSRVLEGVGHTFDFPSRDQAMMDGFNWLQAEAQSVQSTFLDEMSPLPRPGLHALSAYPNPAGDRTTIFFELGEASEAVIAITDLLGRTVLATGSGFLPQGRHEIPVSLSDLPPGFYFYSVTAGTVRETKSIAILR